MSEKMLHKTHTTTGVSNKYARQPRTINAVWCRHTCSSAQNISSPLRIVGGSCVTPPTMSLALECIVHSTTAAYRNEPPMLLLHITAARHIDGRAPKTWLLGHTTVYFGEVLQQAVGVAQQTLPQWEEATAVVVPSSSAASELVSPHEIPMHISPFPIRPIVQARATAISPTGQSAVAGRVLRFPFWCPARPDPRGSSTLDPPPAMLTCSLTRLVDRCPRWPPPGPSPL
mmetsp:Transcript_29620/g.64646  ORF Transcript_29620/g.64646 Transcript_29620/m.64646 type:complete len:229 (-) Transcript_29620:861-1547(-)